MIYTLLIKILELVKTQSIPSPSELKSVSYSEITLGNQVFANAVDTTKGWFGRFIQVLNLEKINLN